MREVHFLAGKKDPIIDYLLTPVRRNKKRLSEFGYKINIYYSSSKQCLSCDILCLISKAVLPMLGEKKAVLRENGVVIPFLKEAKKFSNKLIWFDTSDSTSVTHFELLPFVDLYLKKQLFKDKYLYKRNLYGGRIFSDYYHNQFGISDPQEYQQFFPLPMELAHKVGLSWNIGLGDLKMAFSPLATARNYLPMFFDKIPQNHTYIYPDESKGNDIFLRTSTDLGRPSVAFHRQELVRRLQSILEKYPDLSGAVNGKRLPLKQFQHAMAQTKIMPSPFGWGELGARDFEAFIYGAVLLKPDMTHMETWPDIFIPAKTYQPFDWCFDDLEEIILKLLEDKPKRLAVAKSGQEAFKRMISDQGQENFCKWFIQQIER